MSTLKCTNVQHASAASAAITLASDGSATATLSSLNGGPLSGARNRIINGDMRIDQRNAGASVGTASTVYTLDRWTFYNSPASKFTIQQVSDGPAGFSKSLKVTSSSAYTVAAGDFENILTKIEGYNIADLAWGTASAKTITLSFWVKSSLTGTFGGSLTNAGYSRSYPFSYSISSANTWEYKTITIAGDTSGTWDTTTSTGIELAFGLGVGSTYSAAAGTWVGSWVASATGATSVVGTNGATFYITGVQLEAGTVATPFERRSYGQELALCQRYFQLFSNFYIEGYANAGSVRAVTAPMAFPVQMRATPTRTVITAGTLTNIRGSSTAYAGLGLNGLTSAFASVSVEATAAGLCQCNNQTESMSAEL